MQYKKFILSFFDEGSQVEELNRFIRGHKVVKIEENILPDDHMWVFLVKYLDGELKDTASPQKRSEITKFIPEKELDASQLEKYKRLVDIRLELAKKYDVKAFVIFTNRELGEISKMDKISEEELLKIDGIGMSRMEQYGREFIKMLNPDEESGKTDQQDCPF